MEIVFCYITTKDVDEAKKIGRALVEKKLAACVNILPQMESIYWWKRKIESSQEAVLIAKTERGKVDELITMTKSLHSYSVPCVVVLPTLGGNEAYLNWLLESLQ